MLKKQKTKKNTLLFTIFLPLSLLTNGLCLGYIHSQKQQVNLLIEKNNDLSQSINKLSDDLLKLTEQITIINTKATLSPIVISSTSNTLGFDKYLYLLGAALGIGTTFYVSSLISAKLTGFTLVKFGKILSVSSFISKLPFFEQSKVISCFLNDLATTIRITSLGDEIKSIDFRHINDRDFKPITEALGIFLEKKNQSNTVIDITSNLNQNEISGVVTDAARLSETAPALLDALSNFL